MNCSARTFFLAIFLAGVAGCSSLSPERQGLEGASLKNAALEIQITNALHLPFVDGNEIVELVNGNEIFPAMLEAIRGAKKTITLEKFIWSSGQISTQFVATLCERARAGVKVHVVIDAVGSAKLRKFDEDQLSKAGVQLVKYNPPRPLKRASIKHRTHRKLMIVDGRVGFIGGVCLSDEWQGNAEPGHWRDTHFRVEGPVVAQMQEVFHTNWRQMRSQDLRSTDYFPQLKSAGSIRAQCFMSGPNEGPENARFVHLNSIIAAKKSIRLAHSYFVPDAEQTKALLDAKRRGVKIEIIIPRKGDNIIVDKAGRSRWGELLKAGIVFYEYQPTLYHCKIMIVDDVWVTTGSVNLDERSLSFNDEANLNVIDRQFAATLTRTFEKDKEKSDPLTLEEFQKRSASDKFLQRFLGLFRSRL
jgi:cardiolipin synthase A/B